VARPVTAAPLRARARARACVREAMWRWVHVFELRGAPEQGGEQARAGHKRGGNDDDGKCSGADGRRGLQAAAAQQGGGAAGWWAAAAGPARPASFMPHPPCTHTHAHAHAHTHTHTHTHTQTHTLPAHHMAADEADPQVSRGAAHLALRRVRLRLRAVPALHGEGSGDMGAMNGTGDGWVTLTHAP